MNIFKTIGEDIRAVKDRDPAAQSAFVIWLTYAGLHARWSHEVEHWLWNHHAKGLARFSQAVTRAITGTEIHPAAHNERAAVQYALLPGDACKQFGDSRFRGARIA